VEDIRDCTDNAPNDHIFDKWHAYSSSVEVAIIPDQHYRMQWLNDEHRLQNPQALLVRVKVE